MKISIKCQKGIPWQRRLAPIIQNGLKKVGVSSNINGMEGIPMLLGPNAHKRFESENFLQVNRYFIGTSPKDVHENVAISWNGFNGLGYFCLQELDYDRLWNYIRKDEILPWSSGTKYLLCDQVDNGRSNISLENWKRRITVPYKSRSHISRNPPPLKTDLQNLKATITFNSTVAIESLLYGVPTVAYDEGSPVYSFVGHKESDIVHPDREKLFHILANCQWHYDEIEQGLWWDRLNTKKGVRLCEYNT